MKNEKNWEEPKSQPTPNDPTQKKDDLLKNNIAGIPPQPVFDDQGEEYLRENANIEDMPDEKDDAEYEETIEEEKKKKGKNVTGN